MGDTIDALRAQLTALNDAIAAGVRQVTHGDRTVTYNTTDSLLRARDDLERRLAKKISGSAYPRQTRLYHAGRAL